MSLSYWRDHAMRVVRRVLAEYPGATKKELRKLFREAYPFGQKSYHPYKIWCDVVRRALAGQPLAPGPHGRMFEGRHKKAANNGQATLVEVSGE